MRRAGEGGMKSKLIVWVAQGFGIGRIPFAPGTWGSVLGIVWALLLLWPRSLSSFFIGTAIAAGFAVWCCGRAERILGQHDPGSVVLDEIVVWLVQRGKAYFLLTASGSLRNRLAIDLRAPPMSKSDPPKGFVKVSN